MNEKLLDKIYEQNIFSTTVKKKIYFAIKAKIAAFQKILKNHVIDAEIVLGGSSAKGTFLKKGFDSDIFVRFNYVTYKAQNEKLSDILEPALDELTDGNYVRVHGSRDYFQFIEKKTSIPEIAFEIIPVLYVTDSKMALNVTDVSPLHVVWIQKYLSKELTKQIVLTKLFLKANGLYGAESYIRGFSGHDVDILIVNYGSFFTLATEAQNWGKGTVIDVEHHYPDTSTAMASLNASKLGPLVLVDPVQPERNAAASLSYEKMSLFKERAKQFLENPSTTFFKEKPFSLTQLQKQIVADTERIIVYAHALRGKKDVVGSKLLKVFIHLKRELKKHDFVITDADWHWSTKRDAHFWFFISKASIQHVKKNPILIHKGPPFSREEDCVIFRSKYKDVYEEQGRLFTRIKRDYLSVQALMKSLVADEYVQRLVQKIRVVP